MPATIDELARLPVKNPPGAHVWAPEAERLPGVSAEVWEAEKAYPVGALVYAGNYIYRCTAAGTSDTAAPAWDQTPASVTEDGDDLEWTNVGPVGAQIVPLGLTLTNDAGTVTRRSLANRPWTQRGRAQYIGRPVVEASLTATGHCTEPSYFDAAKGDPRQGGIDLSLSGTWVGTVVLERCFNADCLDDDGAAVAEVWHIVESYNLNVQKVIQNYNQAVKWRVRFSDRTSGTAVVRLSQA